MIQTWKDLPKATHDGVIFLESWQDPNFWRWAAKIWVLQEISGSGGWMELLNLGPPEGLG